MNYNTDYIYFNYNFMIQIALLFMQIFTELIFREIDTIGLIWKYLSIHEIFDDYLCKLLLSVIFWFPFEAFVWLLFFFWVLIVEMLPEWGLSTCLSVCTHRPLLIHLLFSWLPWFLLIFFMNNETLKYLNKIR